MTEYLEIGTIVGTHGIKGEVRVNPACDSPAFFRGFQTLYFDAEGREAVQVLGMREHKNLALLQLEGIHSMEAAERLKAKRLFFRRAEAHLEEGRYFIAELLGCDVFDVNSGERYGAICEVSQTGANDVWHIKTPEGDERLIPVIPDVVKSVDVEKRRVEVAMIAGL